MIAKHMPMRSLKKSDYGGLLAYLLNPQNKTERVGMVTVTNCRSADANMAALEVLNTQAQNRRSLDDKTYHLMVSFRAGEEPDELTLKQIEEQLCIALGYGQHQRVSVVHHDTDHLHMHIAINKIHPIKHTIHTPRRDYKTLATTSAKLERELGLLVDNHKSDKCTAEGRAADMEHNAGIESLLGWIKRECWAELRQAQSWPALHQIMRDHGLRLHLRANGLAITANDGATIKASSLDRSFSKANLETTLGAFVPDAEITGRDQAEKQYQRKPMQFKAQADAEAARLYQDYLAGREQVVGIRDEALQRLKENWSRQIAAAKQQGKLKRAAVKLLGGDRTSNRILMAAISRTLVAELKEINQRYIQERRSLFQTHRRQTWADWLRNEARAGNDAALAALRARSHGDEERGNTLAGNQRTTSDRPTGIDGITKQGTIIICAGSTVVRDDGRQLAITKGMDQAGLQAALAMAIQRYGASIHVSGTAEFRERIARAAAASNLDIRFDDPALESRRQVLRKAAINKEQYHEHRHRRRYGRTAASGVRRGGAAATGGQAQGADCGKPDIGRVGAEPPPASQNRLRALHQLGVVHLPDGGAVLLQGDVRRDVEQPKPAADHGMRRDVPGPELTKARRARHGNQRRARQPGQRTAAERAAPSPKRQAPAHEAHKVGDGEQLAARQASAGCGVFDAPPPARGVAPAQEMEFERGRPRVLAEMPQWTLEMAPTEQPSARVSQPSSGARKAHPQPPPQAADAGQMAALKYVLEREQKRATLSGIPKHLAYDGFQGRAAFAGLRNVDGQQLALLKRGDTILVLPVDDATVRRLKRLALGTMLTVSRHGHVKSKGRHQ